MTDDKPKLLITEPHDFSATALARLASRFSVVLGPVSRLELQAQFSQYDVLFVRLGHQFDHPMMKPGPAAIVTPTTGLNHIDIDAAAAAGIAVLSLRGERAFLETVHATAEHAWGLLLALARKLTSAARHAANGGWDRDQFKGVELAGRTLGVIGYGRLGARTAHYGHAFGMQLIACDPTAELPMHVRRGDLTTVCREADVISVHVTSHAGNVNLISASQFAAMKRNALFINTSRGDIVDEWALLSALQNGRIAGAALDVLAAENDDRARPAADALRHFARYNDNLILTPHIGGATYDSMVRTEDFMVERLFDAIDHDEITLGKSKGRLRA